MAVRDPLWLSAPTRFHRIDRRTARYWLIALAILMLAAATALVTPGPPAASPDPAARVSNQADVLLYQQIASAVRAGENYYSAAAAAQRRDGYPVRPFMTMRLPTLALIEATLPAPMVLLVVALIALAVIVTWYRRLATAIARTPPRLIGIVLIGCGALVCLRPDLVGFHEIWGGLLIALSLGLWRADDWLPAVCVALLAMLIRETAALYAIVMFALAWAGGARREALGWATALGLFALVVAAHIYGWSQVVRPDDPAGPGWSSLLGFGFFAKTITLITALAALPQLIGVLLVALSLFGWASWRDPLGVRTIAVLAAYAALISLFCRTDTFYWGLMVAPLSLAGLVFAPDALRDLFASARGRRITVTRHVSGDVR